MSELHNLAKQFAVLDDMYVQLDDHLITLQSIVEHYPTERNDEINAILRHIKDAAIGIEDMVPGMDMELDELRRTRTLAEEFGRDPAPGHRLVRNLMTKRVVEIREDTPLACDPSSETYWSM